MVTANGGCSFNTAKGTVNGIEHQPTALTTTSLTVPVTLLKKSTADARC